MALLGAAYRFYLGITLSFIAIMIFLLWSLDAVLSWYRNRTKPQQQLTANDLELEPDPISSELSEPGKKQPQDLDEIVVMK